MSGLCDRESAISLLGTTDLSDASIIAPWQRCCSPMIGETTLAATLLAAVALIPCSSVKVQASR